MDATEIVLLVGGVVGGVVLTVLGAYLLHRLQRPRLEIGYQMKSTPLVTPSEHARSDSNIRILYADQEVASLHAFEIRAKNTGNKPLQKLTLIVELTASAKLFHIDVKPHANAEVGEVSIPELRGDNTGSATLSFLNDGDEIRITAVAADGETPRCRLRVPVAGVHCREKNFLTLSEALSWFAFESNFGGVFTPLLSPVLIPILIPLFSIIAFNRRRKR